MGDIIRRGGTKACSPLGRISPGVPPRAAAAAQDMRFLNITMYMCVWLSVVCVCNLCNVCMPCNAMYASMRCNVCIYVT